MDIELTTSKLDSLVRCFERLRTKNQKILTLHLDVFPKFAADISRMLKQQNT